MILSKFQDSPERKIPIAMALVTTGLMTIVVCIAWPRSPLLVAHLGTNWNDFWRGVILGIALVMEIAGLVIGGSAKAAGKVANKL